MKPNIGKNGRIARAITGSHWNGYAFFGLTGDGAAR